MTKPLAPADLAAITEFARRLDVDFRCERRDDRGLRFVAGCFATARPCDGRVVLTMRPGAPPVEALIQAGLLAEDGGVLAFQRLPKGGEIEVVALGARAAQSIRREPGRNGVTS